MIDGARVAVVVPAHNEARLIARTLSTIPAWVDHVVVVDDASSDGTASVVGGLAGGRVELVRHARNLGVGAAITAGYRRAFGRGALVAAVMAGDGQMDPRDLRAVVAPIVAAEADYVKGDRLSHPEAFARMPLARWIGNHGLSAMTRFATGLAVQDSQCGYTALSRTAFDALPLEALWPRYGYPNDLLSHLAIAGLRVRDVVVRPVYGEERSGIRPHHLLTTFPRVLARGLARRATASFSRAEARATAVARPAARVAALRAAP